MCNMVAVLTIAELGSRAAIIVAGFGVVTSTMFLLLVLAAAVRYQRRSARAKRSVVSIPEPLLPPVTVLKPVHGAEPRLEENLESFFLQDYPSFELIFGARSANDPAIAIVEKLKQRHPRVRVKVVFSGPPTWPNAKVFSLERMIAQAEHSFFVISDSDVLAGPDLLRNVIPPLLNPRIGLVTCMYRGVPEPGFWSTMEALGKSVEMPSGVLVADMLEGMKFALGPVMATTRKAIDGIGGIRQTADYYSDDFELGNRIAAAGFRVQLSHYLIDMSLIQRSLRQTFGDQLRWMKSTRYSRPKGHLGTGLTFAIPFGLLGLAAGMVAEQTPFGVWLFFISIVNRVVQSVAVGWLVMKDRRSLFLCWLYPLRDLLGFVTWVGSYIGGNFQWRGETYRFGPGGQITVKERSAETVEEPV
jgi:ceramide glucosyltransferase